MSLSVLRAGFCGCSPPSLFFMLKMGCLSFFLSICFFFTQENVYPTPRTGDVVVSLTAQINKPPQTIPNQTFSFSTQEISTSSFNAVLSGQSVSDSTDSKEEKLVPLLLLFFSFFVSHLLHLLLASC
jgi:hypothetical protein